MIPRTRTATVMPMAAPGTEVLDVAPVLLATLLPADGLMDAAEDDKVPVIVSVTSGTVLTGMLEVVGTTELEGVVEEEEEEEVVEGVADDVDTIEGVVTGATTEELVTVLGTCAEVTIGSLE